MVYGLIELDAIAAVTGMLIVQVAKLWYIDRIVLRRRGRRPSRSYARWDY